MFRALRTGITGLRSNQARIEVIGNNIAGVNTAGFKRSRVLFQDALTQRFATNSRLGGNGPHTSNVGYGVGIGAVDQVWSQGSFENTNLPTDLALTGDGFFVAQSARGPVLTRSGAFSFDANGYLVTTGGLRIQGWEAAADGSVTMGGLTDVRINPNETAAPSATDGVTLSGNLSAERPDADPVEVSSVVYDSSGQARTLVLTMEKATDPAGVATWTMTGATLDGTDVTADLTAADGPKVFNPDGTTSGGSYTLGGTWPDGSTRSVSVDFTGLTHYGGSTTATITEQTGYAAGDLVDYGFDGEGQLVLSYSNGQRRVASQLALGVVANPDGLDQIGDGFYGTTAASGDLRIGRAGAEVPAGVVAGALEASNVDLAEEFTDMIVAQRAYQASARIVTTADELLQETVQLKR